jgi:DNA-directed RNA polymerase subunit M/transcription elongation factor TFIIS
MSTLDPAAEWRRLEELYRDKSDDELEVIAGDAYELTDIARQILEREIRSRGLQVSLGQAPASLEPEPESNEDGEEFDPAEFDLVATQRVWDREEARKIKQIYDDAGIPSYFGPDLVEDVDQYKGNYEQGVEFRVREIDHQRSMAAIADAFHDETGEPGDEPESVCRCPKCRSTEIVFEELEKESPDQPDYLSKFRWSCDACGHQWIDDGIEKES